MEDVCRAPTRPSKVKKNFESKKEEGRWHRSPGGGCTKPLAGEDKRVGEMVAPEERISKKGRRKARAQGWADNVVRFISLGSTQKKRGERKGLLKNLVERKMDNGNSRRWCPARNHTRTELVALARMGQRCLRIQWLFTGGSKFDWTFDEDDVKLWKRGKRGWVGGVLKPYTVSTVREEGGQGGKGREASFTERDAPLSSWC